MPVKAGSFTLQASDTYLGNSDGNDFYGWLVDGVGFQPDLVIVMTAGLASENSWVVGSTHVHGGIAIVSGTEFGPDRLCTGVSESWGTSSRPVSFFSDGGALWLRGSPGNAFFPAYSHEDGFYMGWSPGYEGSYGLICYYLAFEGVSNVGRGLGYQGSPVYNLGWQPTAIFSLGHGGLGADGAGSIAMGDTSVPSWGFGGFENLANPSHDGLQHLANGLTHFTSAIQVRHFWDDHGDQTIFDPQVVAQIISNSQFSFARTATTFDINYIGGFPEGEFIRTGAHVMDDTIYGGDTVLPNPVGVPLEVNAGFLPDAVIFLGPQDHHGGAMGAVPWGGRCFGFLTADFQCCIAWGAYSHIGPNASFCTSDFSWISNFTTTQLSDPTNPNYGTAVIEGTGFTMHTQALPKFNKYVRYAAFGVEEEAPGFFRVIN